MFMANEDALSATEYYAAHCRRPHHCSNAVEPVQQGRSRTAPCKGEERQRGGAKACICTCSRMHCMPGAGRLLCTVQAGCCARCRQAAVHTGMQGRWRMLVSGRRALLSQWALEPCTLVTLGSAPPRACLLKQEAHGGGVGASVPRPPPAAPQQWVQPPAGGTGLFPRGREGRQRPRPLGGRGPQQERCLGGWNTGEPEARCKDPSAQEFGCLRS